MKRRALEFGEIRVTGLSDGRFRLDGGAMFGVVPRVLWERSVSTDEQHRMELALRPLLVETPDARLVIEPGIGDRWSAKERAMYAIDHGPLPASEATAWDGRAGDVVSSLRELGLGTGDIDIVVLTHGHWDHCGAVVRASEKGELEPVFENARVLLPASELAAAQEEKHVRRGSYRSEDLLPLVASGQLEPVPDGAERPIRHEVVKGVTLTIVGGHSESVAVVEIEGGGSRGVFFSDVIPTSHHVNPAYVMAYDMNAELSYEVREPWIERAADEQLIALYYHDPEVPCGLIVRDGRRFRHEPLDESRFTSWES